jgi:hypothetical protein
VLASMRILSTGPDHPPRKVSAAMYTMSSGCSDAAAMAPAVPKACISAQLTKV